MVFVEQDPLTARAPCRPSLRASGGHAQGAGDGNGSGALSARPGRGSPSMWSFSIRHSGSDALAEYVPLLDAGGWVKPGGLVYLESERAAGVPELPPRWELLKSKSAGEVGYHLARVKRSAEGQ